MEGIDFEWFATDRSGNLETEWGKNEAACEHVPKIITYLPKYGCAIYASPKFEKNGSCPLATDGDYWVAFDKLTLSPREIIEISY